MKGELKPMSLARQTGKSMLQQQIIDQMAKEMAEEQDRQVLWSMFRNEGWHYVEISRFQDNHHAVDISYWLADNCQGKYKRNGKEFLFELGTDATMFSLKWMA